jgi:hypothetical protein
MFQGGSLSFSSALDKEVLGLERWTIRIIEVSVGSSCMERFAVLFGKDY